jgi:phytoene desaturase
MPGPNRKVGVEAASVERRTTAIVIGSGIGGLSVAIRLQAAGHRVVILEARDKIGGRASQIVDRGYTFDTGPTLITAPELLRELWEIVGERFDDDIELRPLAPFYRILFQDGASFDYWGSGEAEAAEIAKFNERDVDGYREFLAASGRIYEQAFTKLGHTPFLSLLGFLKVLPQLVRVGGLRSVYDMVSRYIEHPHLRTVFSFHPLFIGGNPFRASAIYSIVPYLERLGGVHFAMGGTFAVIQAMARLFRSLGGEMYTGARVTRILSRRGSVTGVQVQDGSVWRSAVVVANSDVARTLLDLAPSEGVGFLDRQRLRRGRYSMSCFLLYLGVRREYPQLRHHTIIMPDDYRKLVTDIFDGNGLPQDLALYIHTPTRTDPSLAPPGCESIYALAPVPHLGSGIDWTVEADALRDRIIRLMEHHAGLDGLADAIEVEHRYTPVDFRDDLGSHLGAAFSLEPVLAQSAYFRPHNRIGGLRGMYLVGAGTHPGAGIPGVLLTSDITSRLVLEDFPATSRGHRLGIAGQARAAD